MTLLRKLRTQKTACNSEVVVMIGRFVAVGLYVHGMYLVEIPNHLRTHV